MRKIVNISFIKILVFSLCSILYVSPAVAKSGNQVYFVDGYHGGVFGHYPMWKTQFIIDKLNEFPDWRIGMEIEAETWDSVKKNTPEAYYEFQKIIGSPRMDFTNPTYAQPYCYNIVGESLIRQFHYGIKKNREHFPNFTFTTYAVEEPCFTSALPQVLQSFGFKYAVLKCPNTCWGGYMKAYGGELVNWIGPDGTSILTVPRYACEELEPNSVWQTTAWGNSKEYLQACFEAGIENPVGMTYQDAGWRNGPWLGSKKGRIKNNSQYVTWTEYIEQYSVGKSDDDYHLSQEDVLVSLMWGSQALQRIGQQVRTSENKILQAEKIVSMAHIDNKVDAASSDFEKAWRSLLLAQHHDSWIVPYNRLNKQYTWAEKIKIWTDNTNTIADSLIQVADLSYVKKNNESKSAGFVKVYNTLSNSRKELIAIDLPTELQAKTLTVFNAKNQNIKTERSGNVLYCEVEIPAFGYTTLRLEECSKPQNSLEFKGVSLLANGDCQMENNNYRIVFDGQKGGQIKSLIAKQLDHKEFVDNKHQFGFNSLRGHFYDEQKFHSNTDVPAKFTILENNELIQKIAIESSINGHTVTQTVTLTNSQERIDFGLHINWKGNPGIGEFRMTDGFRDNYRASYDDRYKLHILFPANLKSQQVYKNAPFDVCESKLDDTFFKSWDAIKHNIILNWVDVIQENEHYGLALFSDHTTSYLHGKDYPLGLTAQYSGKGLWSVDYKITQALDIRYALIPHKGKWDESSIWTASNIWNEPLITTFHSKIPVNESSFIQMDKAGYDLSAVVVDEDNNLLVRVFNAETDEQPVNLSFNFPIKSVEEVNLAGKTIRPISISKKKNTSNIELSMPQFGFKTIKIYQ